MSTLGGRMGIFLIAVSPFKDKTQVARREKEKKKHAQNFDEDKIKKQRIKMKRSGNILHVAGIRSPPPF